MLRLTDVSQVPDDFGPSVVTIGNFDGVHRGHAALLASVVGRARETGLRSAAVTFDPHPLAVLYPDKAPSLIESLPEKLDRMADIGLDVALVLPFTRELAAMTPEEFVREVFVRGLHARHIVVGRDTRFGVKNSGNVDTLRQLSRASGFEVQVLADVGTGHRYSSTQVRERLAAGDVEGAAAVLGRPHEVGGIVVRGLRRGHELGFPTANLCEEVSGMVPADGVYAGWLVRDDKSADDPDHRMPAAISVGTNPTFDDVLQRTVEAHVIDRDDLDLYGEAVHVQLVQRLRGNTRFESIDALVTQIGADVDQARQILRGTA
ncbi:bifunctional riboflavin kinase/FAD synthetase [Leekyejoonella antrihumi]|uniref:Riboflavin biosynthesis protein n=1 Tax=Leekyejoonella antrihumi TaxID=1660198 RepID=A0A563DXJ1_9MICO|nr:bifunctional riboflavin kinase/FAD synthetase [Leekyejoonella antrihumi]TWP34394.1 bifunctional riboflavin kinase/FAD synthetase [Leekyejoonella antrihumi]